MHPSLNLSHIERRRNKQRQTTYKDQAKLFLRIWHGTRSQGNDTSIREKREQNTKWMANIFILRNRSKIEEHNLFTTSQKVFFLEHSGYFVRSINQLICLSSESN